jgi:hypothetical protein
MDSGGFGPFGGTFPPVFLLFLVLVVLMMIAKTVTMAVRQGWMRDHAVGFEMMTSGGPGLAFSRSQGKLRYLGPQGKRTRDFVASEVRDVTLLSEDAGENATQYVLTVYLRPGSEHMSVEVHDLEEGQRWFSMLQAWIETTGVEGGLANELRSIQELARTGVLDTDEFERAKDRLLGAEPTDVERAAGSLRTLDDLRRRGVITETEFRDQKWEILAKL